MVYLKYFKIIKIRLDIILYDCFVLYWKNIVSIYYIIYIVCSNRIGSNLRVCGIVVKVWKWGFNYDDIIVSMYIDYWILEGLKF